MRKPWIAVAPVLATINLSAGAVAAEMKQGILVPFEDAKFAGVDPARPDGPQLVVLWSNQAHGDSCLTDECLMFIKWDGKRDAKLAGTPAGS